MCQWDITGTIIMSNRNNHIQDYAVSPTEATRERKSWEDSSYQSYKNGNDHCSTRQDEDKHTGNSHIHYMLTGEDEKTIKTDKSGKTDIVKQVEWPE